MTKPSLSLIVFGLVVAAAVLGIYLPGWNNDLLFDDRRLTDGSIFGVYGNPAEFKQRMLSYGSFVWVDALAGPGWGKQRLVNIVLHLGTVAALYALLRELLAQTRFPVAHRRAARRGGAVCRQPRGGVCGGVFDAALHRHGHFVCGAGLLVFCARPDAPLRLRLCAGAAELCAGSAVERVRGDGGGDGLAAVYLHSPAALETTAADCRSVFGGIGRCQRGAVVDFWQLCRHRL